jgi:hypothetical protein
MSRPDLYPSDFAGLEHACEDRRNVDAWAASAHAELEPRKGWMSTTQMGLEIKRHDTLSQRLAATYAPMPWGTIAVVSIMLVLIVVLAVLAAMGGKP